MPEPPPSAPLAIGGHAGDTAPLPELTTPLLSCSGVDVAYDKVQVLFGVDLEIAEGEIVALLGTNGAGKSTLLKAISGLVHPTAGRIEFAGHDITRADPVRTTQLGIVQVPGGRAVFPTLSVEEHFRCGTWLYGQGREVDARVDEVVESFPRLRERWRQLAGNLSGGEQQQLALAMAFVARPRLLAIDELSLGLAPTLVAPLLDMVRAIHRGGCTVILVEQSVNLALTIAERAYFMEKGEIRFSGPATDLLARGDILRSVFLQGAAAALGATGEELQDAAAGRYGAAQPDGTQPGRHERQAPQLEEPPEDAKPRNGGPEDAGLQDGKTRSEPAEGGESRPRRPALEVDGLTRRFGGITAVDDVGFTVHEGEILGLIGANGAGKTTVFDLLSGVLPPDEGRVRLGSADISGWPPDRRAAFGLGRSFQDGRLFPSLTVAENIALGLERHIECRDHLAALLGLPAIQESEEDVAYTVDDLIEITGLGAYRDKFASELSTGTRRVVDLAMAMAHDPTVLLLDEPSSGIAQREAEALGPLLRRIQAETGCAMLVIEHDMPLIRAVSDRIIALDLGRVIVQGPPDQVLKHPAVIAAYLGDSAAVHRSGSPAPMLSSAPVEGP